MKYTKAREILAEALVRVNRSRNPYFNDVPKPVLPTIVPPSLYRGKNNKSTTTGKGTASASQAFAGSAKSLTFGGKGGTLQVADQPLEEAISTNDPNRGRMGRKKPLVPPGMMPDDTINPKTGARVGTFGKLHDRMTNLSPETRNRYRKNYGYRTRVAGRGKRLYPLPESHNIETLKGIPTDRLRKLHAKYKAKGTKEASREASVIGKILASRR